MKRLALENAITQLFEETHAQVLGFIEDMLFQVIHDGDRHPIPDCSFHKPKKKKQLKKQVGHNCKDLL